MMKDGLLEKIKSAGYWRINVRPLVLLKEPLTFKECREYIESANVELRGWDYPHVSMMNSESSGYGTGLDYFENWTDWNVQFEFWRMFKSGQFLHYRNLWEDWDKYDKGRKPPEKPLNVVGAIYTLSEITEFAARLSRHRPYEHGFSLTVTLAGTDGRELFVNDIRRTPFFEPKRTEAEFVELRRTFDASKLPVLAGDTAISMLLELFDVFGWNPRADQIRVDQDRLYSRQSLG